MHGWSLISVVLVAICSYGNALPASLLANLKSGEFKHNKVANTNRNIKEYVNNDDLALKANHNAIKRGSEMNYPHPKDSSSGSLPRFNQFLNSVAEDNYPREYESPYGDILKSAQSYNTMQMPSANYYRSYYDRNNEIMQRNNRLMAGNIYRKKRATRHLSTEEILRLLALLERNKYNKQQHNSNNNWPPLSAISEHNRNPHNNNYYNNNDDADSDADNDNNNNDDQQWLQEAIPFAREQHPNDVYDNDSDDINEDDNDLYSERQAQAEKRNYLYGFANNYAGAGAGNNYGNKRHHQPGDSYNNYMAALLASQPPVSPGDWPVKQRFVL